MYSQNDEERAILQHCPQTGRFLEIGAFHPKILSNTRALYERGWSGVLIEPAPSSVIALLREYGKDPRMTIVQGAMSVDPGWLAMHVTDDALTTSVEWAYEQSKHTGGFYGQFRVAPITWPQLIEAFDIDFDFVSIDAEGLSVDLAVAMFAAGLSPRCLCVELDKRPDDVLVAARKVGDYVEVLRTGENTIVVLR